MKYIDVTGLALSGENGSEGWMSHGMTCGLGMDGAVQGPAASYGGVYTGPANQGSSNIPSKNNKAYLLWTYNTDELNDLLSANVESLFLMTMLFWIGEFNLNAIVNFNATKSDVINALYDDNAALVMVSGHGGMTGSLAFYDNNNNVWNHLNPAMLDKSKLGKNLKAVIFQSCYSAVNNSWQNFLGNNIDFYGSAGITYPIQFTEFSFFSDKTSFFGILSEHF